MPRAKKPRSELYLKSPDIQNQYIIIICEVVVEIQAEFFAMRVYYITLTIHDNEGGGMTSMYYTLQHVRVMVQSGALLVP